MKITSVQNGPTGKTVTVSGTVSLVGTKRSNALIDLLTVESSFFFRGTFEDDENSFTTTTHEAQLDLSTNNTFDLLYVFKYCQKLKFKLNCVTIY
jgi:hypothetical protein